MTRLTIILACLLLGLGPVAAQTAMDVMAATSTAEELNMAGQARSVTRSAITTVFGAGQGAPAGANAPAAAALAPPVPGAAPAIAPGAPATGWDTATAPDGSAPPPIGGEAAAAAAAAAALGDPRRDPFRPFTLSLRTDVEEGEILSPLQRFELPQLRLAGVVLAMHPPRAMLQDNSGMGYIVVPGTPIGRRQGVVKSIEARRIVVEEQVLDYYGNQQPHEVVIEMPRDDKKDDKPQESR
ncbi:MAG: pilus assembly protein PilP [bacterium]